MRAGDEVKHTQTGETGVVAYCRGESRQRVAFFGWPGGEHLASDYEVAKAATDEEHEASLTFWAERGPREEDDDRTRECRYQLAKLKGYNRLDPAAPEWWRAVAMHEVQSRHGALLRGPDDASALLTKAAAILAAPRGGVTILAEEVDRVLDGAAYLAAAAQRLLEGRP